MAVPGREDLPPRSFFLFVNLDMPIGLEGRKEKGKEKTGRPTANDADLHNLLLSRRGVALPKAVEFLFREGPSLVLANHQLALPVIGKEFFVDDFLE